jgi:mRNA-decapping enzyme 1B
MNAMQHQQPQQQQQQQGQGQVMIHQNVLSNGNSSDKKPSDVDIFSMLSKAQAEFNNSAIGTGLEQQLSEMKINQPQQQQQQQQQVSSQQQHQHQPLMKQISMTMPDITSPNVVNFFAAAQQPNGVIPIMADGSGGGPRPFTISGVPVPHHPTIVQPPVQTLDEIEKQHRVASVSPKVEPKLLNNLLNSTIQQQQQQPINPQPLKLLQQQSSGPKLLAPTMFQASNNEEKASAVPPPPQLQQQQQQFRPEPLTHNQLIQALNYLLENDPDFICKIHEAYIKSFNKIVSH